MKSTENFKKAIQNHLSKLAIADELFQEKFTNPEKNIDDCITYILNTVKSSGVNGFEDSEIYNMAVHYYDEENIEVGKKIDYQVVVNHQVEITEEERKAAKQKAIDELVREEKAKIGKKKTTATPAATNNTPTLF